MRNKRIGGKVIMKKQEFNPSNYLDEKGNVEKRRICQDIKNRILTRKEIWMLIENVPIQKGFYGVEYQHKKPIKEWNEEYLEAVSFSPAFNPDFLFYLDDVANYLASIHPKKKEKKKGFLSLFKK